MSPEKFLWSKKKAAYLKGDSPREKRYRKPIQYVPRFWMRCFQLCKLLAFSEIVQNMLEELQVVIRYILLHTRSAKFHGPGENIRLWCSTSFEVWILHLVQVSLEATVFEFSFSGSSFP